MSPGKTSPFLKFAWALFAIAKLFLGPKTKVFKETLGVTAWLPDFLAVSREGVGNVPRADLRCLFWSGGEPAVSWVQAGPREGSAGTHQTQAKPCTGHCGNHRTPGKVGEQEGGRGGLGQKDVVARASGLLEFASSRRDDLGFLSKHLPSPPRGPWSPCDSGRALGSV